MEVHDKNLSWWKFMKKTLLRWKFMKKNIFLKKSKKYAWTKNRYWIIYQDKSSDILNRHVELIFWNKNIVKSLVNFLPSHCCRMGADSCSPGMCFHLTFIWLSFDLRPTPAMLIINIAVRIKNPLRRMSERNHR